MAMLSEQSNLVCAPNRNSSKRKVFALPAGYSGCAFWRYRLPLNKLNALGSELEIIIADNPNKTIRLDDIQKHLNNSDLVTIQSPGYKDALTLMKLYRSEGKKVVLDYDDYSFDLSPGNPRYAELGTKECEQLKADGTVAFKWRDSENGFDLNANMAKFEAFKACVGAADMITVTTEYLADKFRKFNKNVSICPNSIDFNLWKPVNRPIDMRDQIRIGWFGGDSHFVDLNVFKNLFQKIVKKYPKVKIVIQAPPVDQWRDFFKDIPMSNLEWHFWADLRYYTLFLAARHWDIGLCPLDDNDFNRCKSSIKFLEFTAIGAATVAQNMLPYSENIKEGITGCLANTEDEWYEAVCKLIENEELRRHLARNAYQYVFENFNLDRNCRMWENAYKNCMENLDVGKLSNNRVGCSSRSGTRS